MGRGGSEELGIFLREEIEKGAVFWYYGTRNLWRIGERKRMQTQFALSRGELQIPCKLTQPEDGKILRVVMGVHGFGGCAADDIQVSLSKEMELFDSAVFRFDFPAHGESPVGSEGLTLRNCVDSVLAVAECARERFPQVQDLCIFATGFGAFVVLNAVEELLALPGNLRLVVQTPSVRMDETLLAMRGLSQQTLWALDRFTIPAPRPFDVTYRFYEELRENSVMTAFPVPMLILHGERDDYIQQEDILAFRRMNRDAKLVLIPGASHRFLEEGAWDMVLDLTRDWFAFEQVLLCDWI